MNAPANAPAVPSPVPGVAPAVGISAEDALFALTSPKRGFQQWIASKASTSLLDSWNEVLLQSISTPEAYSACCRKHFASYDLPPDCAGWMLQLAVLSESLPLCLTISDAQIAGFPLVFVNSKFVDVTGYTKTDCSGRNCRFLQGPATNPEHGFHLLDTLRRGANSQTLMVNYRKTGAVFENLLTMRYVNDSLGRRRLCVGFQLDLTGMESDPGPWGRTMLESEAGKQLMLESQKKMVKLIKMLPETIDVPAPPDAPTPFAPPPAWRCPQLDALADAVGLPRAEHSGTWLDVLCSLLDEATVPALVVDMQVAGLPISHCNHAFGEMTGYSRAEAVGRNCRFLQGEPTEPRALSQLITAVRQHKPLTTTITNVRKDGSAFPNNLSLHPVHASSGECRFCLAVLYDCTTHPPSGPLEQLRKAMPTAFDARLQPPPAAPFAAVDPIAQWKEFQPSTAKLVRLLWATDPNGALRKLLSLPPPLSSQAVESVRAYLAKKAPDDGALFEHVLKARADGLWAPLKGQTDQ